MQSLITDESFKGLFNVTNPNYKNSDKSVNLVLFKQSETDKLTTFGYKTNKNWFFN